MNGSRSGSALSKGERAVGAANGPVLVRVKSHGEVGLQTAHSPVLVRGKSAAEPSLASVELISLRTEPQRSKRSWGFGLAGASLALTLTGAGLFHYFPLERHSGRLTPEAQSSGRNPAPTYDATPFYQPSGASTVDPKPSPAPANRQAAGTRLAGVALRPPTHSNSQIDVPALDIDSAAAQERAGLDENLSGLPLAPPIAPAYDPARAVSFSDRASSDSNAVIEVLEEYASAWNSKRIAQITTLRPGLLRRTVAQELASARSIRMHIRPTAVPRIQGDRATVECIHQVDQVFTDGTQKKNPGIKMTYVLARRGSGWFIEEAQ